MTETHAPSNTQTPGSLPRPPSAPPALGRDALPRAAATATATVMLGAPLVVHVTLTTGRFAVWAALLAALQTASVVTLATRGRRTGAVWAGGAAALGILLACRVALHGSLRLEAASTHTALYASLLVLFGRTLVPGRTPLVTALARRIHGERPPELVAYTRAVTWAWCGFFAAQLAGSALLALLAPLWVWSLFVNVLDAPLVVSMFMTEYVYRLLRFRNHGHARPADIVRAFARPRSGPASGGPTGT